MAWLATDRWHGWLAAAWGWLARVPAAVILAGLGCAALDASTFIANSRLPLAPALVEIGVLAMLVGAFGCFIAATARRRGRGAWAPWLTRLLIIPLLLWGVWTATQTAHVVAVSWPRTLASARNYGSDDMFYNHYNAWLVLHGQNPYTGERLTAVVGYFHIIAYTPIARGRFADPHAKPTGHELAAIYLQFAANPAAPPPEIDPATTHSYPAGAFLVALPFVWLGAPTIALGQTLALLVLWGLITWAAPWRWRPVVALLLLTMADGARQVAGADFEIWALAFTLGAWLTRDRRWTSAILLGLACATKQTAWLAVPFYGVWVWRTLGANEVARRALIAGGAFLLINAPWIIASPGPWLSSLLLPVSLPLLPDGSGLIGLATAGALPFAPRAVYSALEAATLVGALVWYWRAHARYPFAGLALPTLALLLAWRSPERYFELLPLAGILALALTLGTAPTPSPSPAAAGEGSFVAPAAPRA